MENKSIWSQTCEIAPREPLRSDVKTEVAVIGAGMAGILIASALQRAGKQVVVLESDRIAGGQTRNTTAKITSQHGLIYANLVNSLGKEKARGYAMANEAAIREYRKLVESLKIDCDFEEQSAFVYGDDLGALSEEAQTAKKLGIEAVLTDASHIPAAAAGAVRFDGQAQFHPLKFLNAVSKPLTIYEHTRVLSVENNLIKTEGASVYADSIVFACHYPFINFPGMYFARMHQERSYVIALENTPGVTGMWIGTGDEAYSFRPYKNLLLLGGGGYRTGENTGESRYEALRKKAKEWFPGSREAAHWSAQDCVTADGVPYIGRYADSAPNWYVATGFGKWGMTSSMVSAMIIRDLILGEKNPCSDVFMPERFHMRDIPGIACEVGHAAKGLAKSVTEETDSGVKTICTHMGCRLEWNADEHSWDCPCHGSRFTAEGSLISGPAQTDLERR